MPRRLGDKLGIKVVSWNINKGAEPWRKLLEMDADIALLQEATPPPDIVARLQDATLPPPESSGIIDIGPRESWNSQRWNSDWWYGRGPPELYDRWPMVVKLSDRVDVEWFKQVGPAGWAEAGEIDVSQVGTLAAARVTPRDWSIEPFIAISMYGRWMKCHPSVKTSWSVGYADASVHRIISDIAAFIGHENSKRHRILASGDLNIYHGYGDGGNAYWERRYRSVFERMAAIGLEFIGPQAPHGRQAEIRPAGEPADSRNVVTYRLTGKDLETTSNNQLDYAFASRGFHEAITVRAMNGIEEWGASDHCRLLIEIAGG